MKLKQKSFFSWLIIVLGSVALIGICFTPALATDDGQGILEADQVEGIPIAPDEGEDSLYDGSFGRKVQATWIGSADFTPYDSTTTWVYSVPGMRRITGGSPWMDAGVRLPSGARLIIVRIFYDDADGANRASFWIFKNRYNVSPFTYTTPVTVMSPVGVARYTSSYVNTAETITNAQYWYHARFRTDGNTKFAGVRLFWHRQIRTGLSSPFVDIGGLSTEFRNSIAALYQSGITTGTSPSTFSPNNPVTRGQFATFFARALGLYWDYYSGY